ncbi:MAG TPA: rhomboid family intramembrane serine protease, partial [Thermoanaerobaculia bacterium]|nr:rhomboid family intramembrane serine protease [Thermoanaerobaculia bacterium]
MIPLRDDNPRRTFPFVTYLLVAMNVLAFVWELSLGPQLDRALFNIAFIPARYWLPGNWLFDLLTIVISMFLHGGLMHIGSNMLYLWIFGDNIEDSMGHARYFVFYLLCGTAAALAQGLLDPNSEIPMIGASGAVSGILGAYILLHPGATVRTLIVLGFFVTMAYVPALLVLGIWFVGQLLSASMTPLGEPGIA